jgi:hypothetical protein
VVGRFFVVVAELAPREVDDMLLVEVVPALNFVLHQEPGEEPYSRRCTVLLDETCEGAWILARHQYLVEPGRLELPFVVHETGDPDVFAVAKHDVAEESR